jgi:hypothetical protein
MPEGGADRSEVSISGEENRLLLQNRSFCRRKKARIENYKAIFAASVIVTPAWKSESASFRAGIAKRSVCAVNGNGNLCSS